VKVNIEIPIIFDEELSAEDAKRFKVETQRAVQGVINARFGPGPRMFGTMCRFAFGPAVVEIKEQGE
jgi:hypothetical protein